MATFRVHIGSGNGYQSQEVEIDGVRNLSMAKSRTKQLYPGAKIRSATQIDNLDIGARENREIELEERAERQAQSSARIYGQKDADNERSSGSSSVSFASSSSSNDDGEGFSLDFGSGLALGGLLLGGVSIWFVWMLLPIATMFGGLIAGYKYTSKYTVNVNFHLRMWLVLGAAILSATGGYMAGDKIHELAGIDYKTGAPTNVIGE